jgi:hypothetical protein
MIVKNSTPASEQRTTRWHSSEQHTAKPRTAQLIVMFVLIYLEPFCNIWFCLQGVVVVNVFLLISTAPFQLQLKIIESESQNFDSPVASALNFIKLIFLRN